MLGGGRGRRLPLLPEQFNREFFLDEDLIEDLRHATFNYPLLPAEILANVAAVRRADARLRVLRAHPFYQKYSQIGWPEILTGDDWRTAWAEAHDAHTDKALDAVY